jgi:hypothetical protein
VPAANSQHGIVRREPLKPEPGVEFAIAAFGEDVAQVCSVTPPLTDERWRQLRASFMRVIHAIEEQDRREVRELAQTIRAGSQLPRRRVGRPSKPRGTILGTRTPPPRKPGRPSPIIFAEVLQVVNARCQAAALEGRHLRRHQALCESLADAMKEREPLKYRRLRQLLDANDEAQSPSGALRLALNRVARKHLHGLEQSLSRAARARQSPK